MSDQEKDSEDTPTRYRVTYVVEHHTPGLTAVELEAKHNDFLGAADAVVILSIMRSDEGNDSAYSLLPISIDGGTGLEISDDELWKCWALLTERLAKSPTLSAAKRNFSAKVFVAIRKAVLCAANDGHPVPKESFN